MVLNLNNHEHAIAMHIAYSLLTFFIFVRVYKWYGILCVWLKVWTQWYLFNGFETVYHLFLWLNSRSLARDWECKINMSRNFSHKKLIYFYL